MKNVKIVKAPGFTLIELLITISILLILLAVGLTQYGTYDRRDNLILTSASLKSFIESAEIDAKGRGSDQTIDEPFAKIAVKVDGTGRVINEYRILQSGAVYQKTAGTDYVFSTLNLSDKIAPLAAGRTIMLAEIPTGKLLPILAPATQLNPVILSIGSESISVQINENSITQTQSGF
jgi:prepilin-type N-terminal cleavage/methylation domain-containing protein